MSSIPATRRASAASRTEQQPCLFLPPPSVSHDSAAAPCAACPSTPLGDPSRMNTPSTSYPSRSNRAAATELSTPPLIATTTFLRALMLLLASNTDDTPAAHGWHGDPPVFRWPRRVRVSHF